LFIEIIVKIYVSLGWIFVWSPDVEKPVEVIAYFLRAIVHAKRTVKLSLAGQLALVPY
jgi:hypothetical protein